MNWALVESSEVFLLASWVYSICFIVQSLYHQYTLKDLFVIVKIKLDSGVLFLGGWRRVFPESSVSEMYLGLDPILLPYLNYICVQIVFILFQLLKGAEL